MKANDLREPNKETRQKCFVCEKHIHITQLHHIIPLKDIVRLLDKIDEVGTQQIWLCPNCHAYTHIVYSYYKKEWYLEPLPFDISPYFNTKKGDVFENILDEKNVFGSMLLTWFANDYKTEKCTRGHALIEEIKELVNKIEEIVNE